MAQYVPGYDNRMESFISNSTRQTQELGGMLAEEIATSSKRPSLFRPFWPREARPLIICLQGELGSGKTTFAQGLLKRLGAKAPYTSPTFVVIKQYKLEARSYLPRRQAGKPKAIYHIDAYRITAKDILNLGWEEIISNPENIIIIEWANRIKKIIPSDSLWIKFEWLDNKERKIIFGK